MTSTSSNAEEACWTSVAVGTLIAFGLSIMAYALWPLFGESSSLVGLTRVLPLTLWLGFVVGLSHCALVRDDWSLWRSAKLRYFMLLAVPLVMLGFAGQCLLHWLAGGLWLLLALRGLTHGISRSMLFRQEWRLLLGSALLGCLAVGLWLMFGCSNGPELDEQGCLVGQEVWCEHNQGCQVPWVGLCGDATLADSFHILKKIQDKSGLTMTSPVADEFTWIEEDEAQLVGLYVSGLTTHADGVNWSVLESALKKAGLKPSEVNTEDLGTGSIRGYRYYNIVVCSLSVNESTESKEGSVVISCGPLEQARPE